MLNEYQVIYRIDSDRDSLTLPVRADSPEEAAALIRAVYPGQTLVVCVGPPRPLVEPLGYNVETAAHLLHCSERTLRDLQAAGKLARSVGGPALFPRWHLERVMLQRMNLSKEAA